ncbi:YvcK family protein [Aquihabitans sp. G128]|uniref:gluconeogenesis factor YvcK family protein n=1 Tax=Aquihabitans sp. G128 TaxID=2849779 RepID=UPI001C24518F|nr:gluconeogenesis factor YvcK family protein [Aquihabitans sp. G128]QXC61716.1 YvcK family protein [Aquihabitans sp. G128]
MTGPRVVALGGGHGLAASLRAARRYAGDITAVVSVADDGGSSGRLRAALPDLPAPGDVRRCLSALADDDSPLGQSLEHRFAEGDELLGGHAFGNLLLAALAQQVGFTAAVEEVGRLVGAAGRVLPATTGPVALEGWLAGARPDAARVVGQVAVQNACGVSRLGLVPADAGSPDAVADAILAADQVLVGPGSLFTSVLAAAIVPAVREALAATSATRVYVANLRPQVPETEGFTLSDHVRALAEHHVAVDVVLCRTGLGGGRGTAAAGHGTALDGVRVVEAEVADDRGLVHQPERLATALAALV